jgi:NADPH:quinone reductase-like Zn-dependent oxidoreductase
MKAYEVAAGATSVEDLKQVEREEPTVGPGQVKVRIRAASLNYRDQAIVAGKYLSGPLTRATVPLSDGAGEVVEVGAGVERFAPGDRVAATFFQGWVDGPRSDALPPALGAPLDGVLAEYLVLDESGWVSIPDHMSFEEAAALPCAAVTAWHALMVANPIRAGDTILALGTGGVSIFALQIARMAGARALITSSSDEKLERARALGAADTINYRSHPAWEEEVLRLTAGRGVDHVVEVGGVGTLARSFKAVATSGTVSLIGVLAGREGDTNPQILLAKAARLQGIFVGSRRMFEDMNRAFAVNEVRPVIDRVFSFDQAAEAYAHQLAGAHFGKIVISV